MSTALVEANHQLHVVGPLLIETNPEVATEIATVLAACPPEDAVNKVSYEIANEVAIDHVSTMKGAETEIMVARIAVTMMVDTATMQD